MLSRENSTSLGPRDFVLRTVEQGTGEVNPSQIMLG